MNVKIVIRMNVNPVCEMDPAFLSTIKDKAVFMLEDIVRVLRNEPQDIVENGRAMRRFPDGSLASLTIEQLETDE